MENTNTDARKAAEQFYESQRKLGFTESITSNDSPDYTLPFYQSIFSLMIEFAQSRLATLEKSVLEQAKINAVNNYIDGFKNISSFDKNSIAVDFGNGWDALLKRFDESLSEQSEAKETLYSDSELNQIALDHLNTLYGNSSLWTEYYSDIIKAFVSFAKKLNTAKKLE